MPARTLRVTAAKGDRCIRSRLVDEEIAALLLKMKMGETRVMAQKIGVICKSSYQGTT